MSGNGCQLWLAIFAGVTFKIVGSDISRTCLDWAKRGIYKDYSVKNMPGFYLNKYFTKVDGMFHLNDSIRNMVKYVPINLYDENSVRAMSYTDVIFCANVL